MGKYNPVTEFLFSLFGYAIIIFVTVFCITLSFLAVAKAMLNARNGEWGGFVMLCILAGVMLLWLYFDGEDDE